MLDDDRNVARVAREPLLVVGEERHARSDRCERRAALGRGGRGSRKGLELLAGVHGKELVGGDLGCGRGCGDRGRVLREGTLGRVPVGGERALEVADALAVEVAAVEAERAVDEVTERLADHPPARCGVPLGVHDPQAHNRPASTAGPGFAGWPSGFTAGQPIAARPR
jgi:hypothetical protein